MTCIGAVVRVKFPCPIWRRLSAPFPQSGRPGHWCGHRLASSNSIDDLIRVQNWWIPVALLSACSRPFNLRVCSADLVLASRVPIWFPPVKRWEFCIDPWNLSRRETLRKDARANDFLYSSGLTMLLQERLSHRSCLPRKAGINPYGSRSSGR